MDAKEFLEKHGLSQLMKLIVEDNKVSFQSLLHWDLNMTNESL